MADSDDRQDPADRPQDPLVRRLRPDPSTPPEPTKVLEGVLGDSDRPGYRRLYFTAELDYYAEFRGEDVLAMQDIPPERDPFVGEEGTRVTLRRDAPVDYTHASRARPMDEFDLDVRLAGLAGTSALAPPDTWEAECPGDTWGCPGPGGGGGTGVTICKGKTCVDWCDDLTDAPTCQTCKTKCGTCGTCNTCQTKCGQPTCVTCATLCNQQTCQTCQTKCGQATCQTCHQATCQTCKTKCGQWTCEGTCNPHVFTCGNNPQCG